MRGGQLRGGGGLRLDCRRVARVRRRLARQERDRRRDHLLHEAEGGFGGLDRDGEFRDVEARLDHRRRHLAERGRQFLSGVDDGRQVVHHVARELLELRGGERVPRLLQARREFVEQRPADARQILTEGVLEVLQAAEERLGLLLHQADVALRQGVEDRGGGVRARQLPRLGQLARLRLRLADVLRQDVPRRDARLDQLVHVLRVQMHRVAHLAEREDDTIQRLAAAADGGDGVADGVEVGDDVPRGHARRQEQLRIPLHLREVERRALRECLLLRDEAIRRLRRAEQAGVGDARLLQPTRVAHDRIRRRAEAARDLEADGLPRALQQRGRDLAAEAVDLPLGGARVHVEFRPRRECSVFLRL
jgi:hypothetical protein